MSTPAGTFEGTIEDFVKWTKDQEDAELNSPCVTKRGMSHETSSRKLLYSNDSTYNEIKQIELENEHKMHLGMTQMTFETLHKREKLYLNYIRRKAKMEYMLNKAFRDGMNGEGLDDNSVFNDD